MLLAAGRNLQWQAAVNYDAYPLKGHNTQHSGHTDFLNELMVEIFSKSLVRAIGKVLHMTFS